METETAETLDLDSSDSYTRRAVSLLDRSYLVLPILLLLLYFE